MRMLTLRLAHLANIALLLLFLIAALFALGVYARATNYTYTGVSTHQMRVYDDPPPGH